MNLGPAPGEDEPTNLRTEEVTEETYLAVLDECLDVLQATGARFGFMGGLASSVLGRHRTTSDIDVLVRVEDAPRLLETFSERGFATERTNPDWLFKAVKRGLLVDIIFRATDGTAMDEKTRVRVREFRGRRLPVVAAEDLLLLKLPAFNESTPQHWFDCLAMIEQNSLDWPYLVKRASRKPHRLLALLDFARGEGLPVPEEALATLRRASLSSAA